MDILDDSNFRGGEYEPASPLLSLEEDIGEFVPPSRLRRSGRRHWMEPHLNITSFVDVLSVLLFFLLSVATLEKLGAHDVNLPRQTDAFTKESTIEVKNLSVSVAPTGLKLRAVMTVPGKDPDVLAIDMPLRDGRYDLDRVQSTLLRLKDNFKTDDAIILMVNDDVSFDVIVKVMDAVREKVEFAEGEARVTRLFPQVSLSDYLIEPEVNHG